MISIELTMSEYEEQQRQRRAQYREPTRRRDGTLTRAPDMLIAAVADEWNRPGMSIVEKAFGHDWDKPDPSNPLGCIAHAARNGWFNEERQRGFERERMNPTYESGGCEWL